MSRVMDDPAAEMADLARIPRRHAAAQDQINAARAHPSEAELDAQLSDAALQSTPAVREMGGPPSGFSEAMKEIDRAIDSADRLLPNDLGGPACNHVLWTVGCPSCTEWAAANGVAFARHMATRSPPSYAPLPYADMPPGAILIAGPQAEAYRALEAASKRALAAQIAHQQSAADLRACIETLCRAMAPATEAQP